MPNAPDSATVTQILHALQDGEEEALSALFPLVYDELHAQARKQRNRWQGHFTVNTTALVHEAYLKLVDQDAVGWNNRAHFFGVAAKAMRHILVDYARRMQRQKRGGDVQRVSLDGLEQLLAAEGTDFEARADDMAALGMALERLASTNERQARVVECRFFGGMTIPDTADALGISPATVKRDWVVAQAWLYREITKGEALS
ncbi:MAG: sigma-70 family RNA polymerase sigma factor [Bacteroidota bacterium]